MALTPAGDILEGVNVTILDTLPLAELSAGEGAPGEAQFNEDYVATTANSVQYSTYHLGPRIPTQAKIKRVKAYTKGIDTNGTGAMAFDVNLIFSDAPLGGIAAGAPIQDGTPPALAGLIPTSANTGATTTIASYTSPNKLFGSAKLLAGNAGAVLETDLTFANTFTFADKEVPLWDLFGFTNNAGNPADPGGFFDFFLVCTTAANTAAAGVIGIEVDYVV
jgi:hypothetical protein